MNLPWPFWRRHWPWLAVSVAPLILFAPFLLGLRVLYWGTPLLQFYPWRKLAFDLLRAGQWPLWNPYLGNGAPLLANLQSAVFYPPNWLGLMPGVPLEYSFSWLVALHWIWAGLGMVTLARALGLKPLGQAVAGLAFGLCQYQVARAWFFSINATVAWLPWVIWAGDRALVSAGQRGHWGRYAWLLALFVAMQLLAGHAQTAWYTLLLLAAWTLWRTVQSWAGPDLAGFQKPARSGPEPSGAPDGLPSSQRWGALRPAAALVLPLLLAGLLAALQLLPTAELLHQSPRADAAGYDFVVTYSFSPWRLLTLLAPDLLGNPARGQYYGYGNYWEDAVYAGVLPLFLAAAAIWGALAAIWHRVRRWRQTTRGLSPLVDPLPPENYARPESALAPGAPRFLVPFLTLVLMVTLVLALGYNTPVFPWLYRSVPTFNLFQAPARMLVWFEFALALLAGVGAGQMAPLRGRARRWARRAGVGSVSVILTGVVFLAVIPGQTPLGQQFQTVARALATLGVSLLLTFWLLLGRPAGESDSLPVFRWQVLVAAFIAADLIYAGWGLNPGASPDLYRTPSAAAAALRTELSVGPGGAGHRLFQFPDDDYFIKYSRFLSFKTFGTPELAAETRAAEVSNASLLDGLASSVNYEPLVSARYADFINVISATSSVNLLHLMDVGVIANSQPLSYEVVATGGPVTFYRMPGPGEARRVRVVYAARTLPNAAAARLAVADLAFDPEREVILEADDADAPAAALSPWLPSMNGETFSVSLSQAGWVVVSDTCYPGWAAFVDGQPAPLRCGDYAFWAVAAPAGEHTVIFQYQPRSFALGLWLSVAAWLVWVVAGVTGARLKLKGLLGLYW
jgi:hypothetical protein